MAFDRALLAQSCLPYRALTLVLIWLVLNVASSSYADNVLRDTPSGISNGKTPGQMMGGNVNTRPNNLQSSLDAIDFYADMNLGTVRVASNPGQFWVGGTSNPTPDPNEPTTRAIIDHAISKGVEPYFLINYRPLIHGGSWNDYSQQDWYDLGRAYALEYQDRVKIYTFINEPDNFNTLIDPNDYADSLESFADGVHSVSTELKVSTGGFATIANPSITADFLTAIAPLANSGDLYALNIHTYNSLTNSNRIISDGTNDASPNEIFADQKAIAGITADIPYSAAEWNLRNTNDANDDQAAADFLTAMWDHMGVVGNGGNNNPVTEFATVFQLRLDDPTKGHALADSLDPVWDGNERGDVFEMVMNLSHDLPFTEVRPIDDGYFILEKELGKKIWVLQNRTGWRDDGSTLTTTVADIPSWAEELELWYWDGLDTTVSVPTGVNQLLINIRAEETVMIVAEANFPDGDFNFDDLVDGRDFLAWQRGESPNPFSSSDLALWEANYGTGTTSALSTPETVPEPSAALLALWSLTMSRVRMRTPRSH